MTGGEVGEMSPTFVTFLIAAVTGLAGFIVWLVKTVIGLVREAISVMVEVKTAVNNNTQAFEKNSSQVLEVLQEVLDKVRS
jgi:hypothetical protein